MSARRQRLKLFEEWPEPLTIKVASTSEELKAAYKLLHDVYKESGLTEDCPSGMRLNVFQALPGTTTFIALWDNQVIATMSTITDSSLGLPMDKIFDLTQLRSRFERISETSGLAIDKEFRGQHGKILFPMIKFLYALCESYTHSDCMVIAVNPKQKKFYEDILLFDAIPAPIINEYDFVKGAPAIAEVLSLADYKERYQACYDKGNSNTSNLFEFFFKTRESQLLFPKPKEGLAYLPSLSADTLKDLFCKEEAIIPSLSDAETQKMRAIYNLEEYRNVFQQSKEIIELRKDQRYDVTLNAVHQKTNQVSRLSSLSEGGLSLFRSSVSIEDLVEGYWLIENPLNVNQPIPVKLKLQWVDDKILGFRFVDADDSLQTLLDHFRFEFVGGIKAS